MGSKLGFEGRVAIITGAGNGLGRAHALLFGSRGAKVVVNDLGGGIKGEGKSSAAADKVVAEIKAAGGEAVADHHSVEDGAAIVKTALDAYGRVDIVVNNAGILRDTSFHKMSQEDWDLIYKVHVLGGFRVTHAAWPHLREQQYGRIIFTSSAAGIYGNFGQANYSMAKLGLLGFANTLAHEGRTKNVLVNTIAPIAGSRLTETVLPKELIDALKPEYVSPLVAWLCHEDSEETGGLFEVGGGFFAKLRWERSEGKSFRLGRSISPELVKEAFGSIAGFEKTTHPTDVTTSMAPVLSNVQAGPSKGGNDLIDVDQALGFDMPESRSSYDERDLALYALSVGASADPLDARELPYVYELHGEGFRPLPTYAVVPAINAFFTAAKEGLQVPGFNFGLERILHGEQYTELKRPLPPHAKLTHKTRIKEILDKGKNALINIETRSFDERGRELLVNNIIAVVRGAGGWGGERGASVEENLPPNRAPDVVVTEKLSPNQALLYRLCGDWNPLHADPSFAQAFGFERPILHGLCTFGYAGRAVVNHFLGGDPRRFKSIKVRMAATVYPGETLVTELWKESETRVVLRVKVKERDVVAISNAAVELWKELPREEAPPVPEAKAAPVAAEVAPISADIFTAIGRYAASQSGMAAKIGTVFVFKLAGPDSAWTVDLKNGAGSVSAGDSGNADCTLELSDADFMGMCTGRLDAQKLFLSGKLKISGNIMASQKLEFLKKMDPALVMGAARERGGGGAQPAAAPAASFEASSADVFVAIKDHLARNPELAAKIGQVFQFRLKSPDSVWTIDLKNGAGAVSAGESGKADCTLELLDSDFMAMTGGQADPQKLFLSGKLKISGNMMAAQKLEFLKKMDPEQGKAAILAARKAGAPSTTPAASPSAEPKHSRAPELMEKLAQRLAQTPALAKEVGALVELRLRNSELAWVLDLRQEPGTIRAGKADAADATLTLEEADLLALVRGVSSAQRLFQQGAMRVDGDVRLAQRLGFLKGLI